MRTPCTLPLDPPLSSLFLRKLFLFTQELAYVCINISSNTWKGYTAENQEERRDSIPILVSGTVKTQKFKLLYEWMNHAMGIYFLFIFNLV